MFFDVTWLRSARVRRHAFAASVSLATLLAAVHAASDDERRARTPQCVPAGNCSPIGSGVSQGASYHMRGFRLLGDMVLARQHSESAAGAREVAAVAAALNEADGVGATGLHRAADSTSSCSSTSSSP